MPRTLVSLVVPSLIAAVAALPAGGRVARADDTGPTVFQRAISSWMGVVTLLAADGDGERKDGADGRRERQGHERQGHERPANERRDRGDREGRDRGPGPWGPGPRMHASPPGMPPVHAVPGMAAPGPRLDSTAKLDEIVDRLARIERKLDAAPRMANPWSPRSEAGRGPSRGMRAEMPEEMRREMEKRRDEMRKRMEEARAKAGEAGRGGRPAAPMAAMPPEMQERLKNMMDEGRKRMAEAQEKMEQARRRFGEMEERIKKLEAEVERLKAGR